MATNNDPTHTLGTLDTLDDMANDDMETDATTNDAPSPPSPPPTPTDAALAVHNAMLHADCMPNPSATHGKPQDALKQLHTARAMLAHAEPDVRNAAQTALADAVRAALAPQHPLLAAAHLLPSSPSSDTAAAAAAAARVPSRRAAASPETEALLATLVLVWHLDAKSTDAAADVGRILLERLRAISRRSLDPLAERAYAFTALAYERAGRLAELRPALHAALRSAQLHHFSACHATLLNLLLRSLVESKLYVQAEKLISKSAFPDTASNCQMARYLYYNGRIKAVQLEYTDAHRSLLQAARKAPQSAGRAQGFKLTVAKLDTIVQLLLGEVPERAVFRAAKTRAAMRPYLELVQAVRLGRLANFRAVMEEHAAAFEADGNHSLVLRLRQNVIRAGLRNVSLAYSRIPLADAAAKLALDKPADMGPIASKAIRDGVIDATIDIDAAVLVSSTAYDACATFEPQQAFHRRIGFCLNLHNEAVRAMSYPADAHKDELPSAEVLKERQREEQELMESIGDEEDF